MNILLVRAGEVGVGGAVRLRDRRHAHLRDVLHVSPGQRVRAGIVNGKRGRARVESIDERETCLRLECAEEPPLPRTDLVLALPRPKVLKRLWSALSMLGVGRICLVNAEKVEKNYFSTHWLRPENYEAELLRGLEQAGDTRLPSVEIVRRLKPFLEDRAEGLFGGMSRRVGHPRLGAMPALPEDGRRCVAAVGPEGGWTRYELDLFAAAGFEPFSLGPRILRSDVACLVTLGRLQGE